uniref:6,7-dimethyl-8-ribityllumazine synthase n=1 Tax=Magnetococcus massalia (strain MO-1) TaxID=451514 RepID=A0A1S7LPU4_MAGMO|nr:6,7-dimethyl-8-ribityllumazine synthase [Candidatus Magnetococcus massalia]
MGEVQTVEGNLTAEGQKYCLLVSRFNSFITERLLEGAIDCLVRHGAVKENLTVARVPGAFELPLVAQKAAKSGKYDGIICLGAVIRGSTPHFDYVSAEVTKGIASIGLEQDLPIGFGVLTTDTVEQAIDRAGTKVGNKGWEAAISIIEMINLLNEMN